MIKKFLSRMMDIAVIAALVFGTPDVRTFAFWIVALMVPLLLVGVFAMDAALAEKIQGLSIGKKAFAIAINCAYIGALIYAGFPVLAAVYSITILLVRVAAETKLKAQEKH